MVWKYKMKTLYHHNQYLVVLLKLIRRRYFSRDLFKIFPGQLVSWTWRTSPWTSRDAHSGSDHVRSIKSKVARHLKTNYNYVYRWFLQLGTQMMMWPTSGQPEGSSRPSGKFIVMLVVNWLWWWWWCYCMYLTVLFPQTSLLWIWTNSNSKPRQLPD